MAYEKILGDYLFSNDKLKLQVDVVHDYLSKESYWARNIPLELVEKSIEGSVCFGVYYNVKQIGFARVITDTASFGYLADVFIVKEFRGKGLSKELMAFIMNYDPLKKLRRFMLATKDAHELYTQFGFKALAEPARFMEIKSFESYTQ
ncbi:GNAT family N-acetyltransferase [Aurantibacillus circumpalustris]|uniref:GNAT family N-acetyltransferase n=1 Tax=Aurantibacillus circumpalustris TaxID=3036359 RepID=UPI00295BF70C|nr:GNAT family N-acetyltransferase [Aurantibacillus circumpalustris]